MSYLALRAQMRHWVSAASITLSSVGFGARHAASRDATATNGSIRVRLRRHATRLNVRHEPVALLFDNQRWPYTMVGLEQHHAAGPLCWAGPRHCLARRPSPGWTAVVLPCAMRARSATDTRTNDVSFDLTIELSVVLRSMSLTIEVRARSIRRQSAHVDDLGNGAALRQLARRWFALDDN